MANILIDVLPTTLTVDGEDVPIYSDFRSCLRALVAFEDNELTPQEKQIILLGNIYPEIPENVQDALKQAYWFLGGGNNTVSTEPQPRLVSYSKDANMIFAAFRQTHNIDLSSANLHWWAFLALFMDLGQDTLFCQVTSLRSRVASGKATKEDREQVQALGELFEVEDYDDRTIEEKEIDRRFAQSGAR